MTWNRKDRPEDEARDDRSPATTATLEHPAGPPVRPDDGEAAGPPPAPRPGEPRVDDATGPAPPLPTAGAPPTRPGDPDTPRREAPAAGQGLPRSGEPGTPVALFDPEEAERLRSRWSALQGSFVDEPRESVARADELVQDTLRSLHEVFQRERRQFEDLWAEDDGASTEDLRLALQRYRALFERLLEK